MSANGLSFRRVVAIVLLIAGIALLIAGLLYHALPADKLPPFLGRLPHVTAHRSERAQAGVFGGGLLLVAAYFAFRRSRAPAR